MRNLALGLLAAVLTLSIGLAILMDAIAPSPLVHTVRRAPELPAEHTPPPEVLRDIQEAQEEADSMFAQTSDLSLPFVDFLSDTLTGDWAARAPIPPWVLSPDSRLFATSSATRSVEKGGSRQQTSREESGSFLLLAIRVQGNSLVLDDVGLNGTPVSIESLKSAGGLRVLDDCGRRVSIIGQNIKSLSYLRVNAREVGRMGDWFYALVGTDAVCEAAARRLYSKRAPTREERIELANAFSLAPAEIAPPAGVFQGSDIRELATSNTINGVRYAFGVARVPSKTQLAPPPPWPQFAFIAKKERDDRWRLVWSLYVDTPRSRLGLAGVYDADEDGVVEPLFAIRLDDRVELMRIVLDGGGSWRETQRTTLAAIQ